MFPMALTTIKIKWTGFRPLIMNNGEAVDPENPFTIENKEIRKTKSKDITPAQTARLKWLDWRASIYWDDDVGLYIPADNILKTIIEGARKIRAGKQAESTLIMDEEMIPIQCGKVPKTPEGIYERAEFKFLKMVRIPPRTGARMMKLRCVIPTGWVLEFPLTFDDSIMKPNDVKRANIEGGSLIGLCDWRPRFGRFQAEFS